MTDHHSQALSRYEHEQARLDLEEERLHVLTAGYYIKLRANLSAGDLLSFLSDFGVNDEPLLAQMTAAVYRSDACELGTLLMDYIQSKILREAKADAERQLESELDD